MASKTISIREAISRLMELKWKDGNIITGLKRKSVTFLYPSKSRDSVRKELKYEIRNTSTKIARKQYKIIIASIERLKTKPEILPSGKYYNYRITLKAM